MHGVRSVVRVSHGSLERSERPINTMAAAIGSRAALHPLPWQPGEAAPAPPADAPATPLLLLLDRRAPLDMAWHRRLQACLTTDERRRHDAFRLPADRQRFLLGRAGLRLLLGAWLQRAPEAVPLQNGPHGKPHCPIGPAFNLSHSGDLILLAVHPHPVGVDVEQLRPRRDWRGIARRVLTEQDLRILEALPQPQQPEAFLAAWCRLEARLKARGTGLAGLAQLRRQERQGAQTAPRHETPECERRPVPDSVRSGSGATTAGSDGDHEPRTQAAAPVCEQVWDVQVPSGYRAAVALAPHPHGPGGSGGSSRSIRSSGVSG